MATRPSARARRKPKQKRRKTPYKVTELCFTCGQCDEVCPFDAIIEARSPAGFPTKLIDPDLCRGCHKCVEVCPIGAIVEGAQPGFEDPGRKVT
ncbi:MAG: 4Fe-4S dicluster domain-containing protein [Actinobacteria bacterium]|nr:MAG: 4Fe-4S dicluster domain-containing protein [Actinomycetota bacterium]RIK02487.1 MAG: hypothetical protein DCC48_18165 [Acidobacteriota bacterium]